MDIYVASSWRNIKRPAMVKLLRDIGHEVYDFKNPEEGKGGFSWSEIDPNWQSWTPAQFEQALLHPLARDGFDSDMMALCGAGATLLVMPCGRSAHLELGVACGMDQKTAIYLPAGEPVEPELMWNMADKILGSEYEVLKWARGLK